MRRVRRDGRDTGQGGIELLGVAAVAALLVTAAVTAVLMGGGNLAATAVRAFCEVTSPSAGCDVEPGLDPVLEGPGDDGPVLVGPELPVQPTLPVEPVEPAPVDPLVADLAEQLGVPPGDLVIVSVEEVTWNDGSLGCARGGFGYTQALVDGKRITVQVGGRTYYFHSGRDGKPFHCARPTG